MAGFLGLGASLLTAAFPLGVLGLSYFGARQVFRATIRRRRSAMGELFDKILAEVLNCVEDRGVEGGNTAGQLPAG